MILRSRFDGTIIDYHQNDEYVTEWNGTRTYLPNESSLVYEYTYVRIYLLIFAPYGASILYSVHTFILHHRALLERETPTRSNKALWCGIKVCTLYMYRYTDMAFHAV